MIKNESTICMQVDRFDKMMIDRLVEITTRSGDDRLTNKNGTKSWVIRKAVADMLQKLDNVAFMDIIKARNKEIASKHGIDTSSW